MAERRQQTETPEPASSVVVTLTYDRDDDNRPISPPRAQSYSVTPELASALARAAAMNRSDQTPIKFLSLLAGMVTGTDDLSAWMQHDLATSGVPLTALTAGLTYDQALASLTAPGAPTATSGSSRQAIEEAQRIAAALEGGGPLDLRHLAAAFPVLPGWHLDDFTRLKIDRLAWCRRVGAELATRYPDEKWYWKQYADRGSIVPLTSFSADVYTETDLVGIDRTVDALALLVASTRTDTPLAIGVFGPWGSGKSFFMRHLRKRIWGLAEREQARVKTWVDKRTANTATRDDAPLYYERIAQVEFNAWHYNESNLVASLVEHLFRNLTVAPKAGAAELEEQRAQLMVKVSGALGDVDDTSNAVAKTKQQVDDARAEVARTQDEVKVVREQVAKSTQELAVVQKAVEGERADLDDAIAKLVPDPGAAFLDVALAPILDSEPVNNARAGLRLASDKAADWDAWFRRLFTLRGLFAVMLVALGPATVWVVESLKGVEAAVTTIVTTVAGALVHVTGFMKQRRAELEAKMKELEAAEAAQLAEQKQQLEDQRKSLFDQLTAKLQAVQTALAERRAALVEREAKVDQAVRALAARTAELDAKVTARGLAETKLRELEAQLKRLSSALLLEEFIRERSGTDEYRKQLGFLALVRRDFERLSSLITSANAEWLDPTKGSAQPPLLNRIVLYIDDLDRCKPETVVAVLEAVHLLLAFPLFVCVVAVDPLWVEQCLRDRHQRAFVDESAPATVEGARRATVGDYLEKIFQIPIWMTPIESRQRAAVVKALLGTTAAPEVNLRPGAGETPANPTRAVRDAPLVDNFAAARKAGEENPDPLQITGEEGKFVDLIAPLLSDKPRALKRFVNTYRLLKASLGELDRKDFMAPGSASPYKLCLSQLALFTGQPRLAPVLVQELEREPDPGQAAVKLGEWIAKLDAERVPDHVRKRLTTALELIPDHGSISVEAFRSWIPDTGRYLFHRNP